MPEQKGYAVGVLGSLARVNQNDRRGDISDEHWGVVGSLLPLAVWSRLPAIP